MKCPSCGAEASGRFCSLCGSPLHVKTCGSCGAATLPGAKFCNNCGKTLSGARGKARAGTGGAAVGGPEGPGEDGGSSNLAWWVAGALLVAVILALGYPILRPSPDSSVGGMPGGVPAQTPGAVDLTTMSLDEQATRLFNRVMSSNSTGDTADVAFFLPKALTIHEQVAPTDPDGIYHYTLLYLVGGDFQAALAKAQEGLVQVPDYLLLLAAGAEAALGMGDTATAGDYYRRLLEAYDTEMGLDRPGYDHHQRILPTYREEARTFLGQG